YRSILPLAFTTGSSFGVGTSPYSVKVADFNKDGNLDLAVANYDSDDVSVLLGNGSGGFGAASNLGVGSSPYSVAVGDFNKDGNLDLVAANSFSNNVSVLLGNGSGGFAPATTFGVGTTPYSVIVEDFNKDSNLDLVVANYDSNNVSVLLGNGSGGFGAASIFGVGTNPTSVAAGDFNNDGNLDLAVANSDTKNVSILLGNGAGSFGAATNIGVGSTPYSVVVGDFNKDGNSDLATANYSSNNVSVLLGNGNGTFGTATNFGVGSSPISLVVGDFNKDTNPDLAVTNYFSNSVSVLLGNGAGSFGAATNFGVGSTPYSVAVGDFDKDNDSDLVVANSGSNNVLVLFNGSTSSNGGNVTPKVNFGAATYNATEGSSAIEVTIAVSLDATPNANVTVPIVIKNTSTATSGNDYTFSPTSLTFNAGATGSNLTQLVTFTIQPDDLPENAETVVLNFGTLTGAVAGTITETTLNIAANDAIQYAISSNTKTLTEGNSGTQSVTFTVTRSGGIGVASTVDYAFSGTAAFNSDYNNIQVTNGGTALSGTLSFGVGETTKTITVDVLGENAIELDENIIVTLTNPNLATAPANSTITTNSAQVDIINDDVIVSQPLLINEILFDPPSTDTSREYIELRGTPGATISSGTYLVAIEGDSGTNPGAVQDIFDLSGKQFGSNGLLVLLQKGNTYTVNPGANVVTNTGSGTGWGNGTSSSMGHIGQATDIENGSVSFLLIQSNSAPTLTNDIDSNNDGIADGASYSNWSVLDSVAALDGGTTDLAYGSIVFRKGAVGSVPTNATVVDTSFIAGYVGRSGNTTGSTASDWVASLVTGTAPNLSLDTGTDTSPENFGGQPLNHIGSANFVPPNVNYAISTSTPTLTEGNSSTQPVTFTVTRTGDTGVATTVNYVLDGTATVTSDYNSIKVGGVTATSSGALIFAAGETSKTITLNVVGEKVTEANETINLNLSYPNQTTAIAPGVVTIVNDDDPPTISIVDKSGTEDSGTFAFTVKLSNASSEIVTVDYSTSNDTAIAGADYTPITGTLIFNPGVISQTITVPVIDDFIDEINERFFVNLTNPTNATIIDNQANGTITDDDTAGFTISAANGLVTTEDGGSANFTIQLNSQPTADVTLSLSSSKPSEGTVSASSITFTAANWNTPQTITVTGVNDGVADDNIVYQIITGTAVSSDAKYNNVNPSDVDAVNIKTGNQISSIITGSASVNNLQGTSSDDLIFGFAGNDIIVGGTGNDRIYGGLGTDNLTGGAGNDIFVLAKGEGRDTIKDFNISEDLIALSGGVTFSNLSITQSVNDTLIKITATNESLALLTGITASTINASHFITY
ncbi:MAG: FG-GAP-like repeat-containing protein, partial [Nostoc sp. ChiSLP02]|nr:FG-GAP-like repeat-containing protein [Nostoc sp. ChiSLP02]